jgi:hypothetical protein
MIMLKEIIVFYIFYPIVLITSFVSFELLMISNLKMIGDFIFYVLILMTSFILYELFFKTGLMFFSPILITNLILYKLFNRELKINVYLKILFFAILFVVINIVMFFLFYAIFLSYLGNQRDLFFYLFH